MTDQYQWITTDEDLALVAKQWASADAIAIDTEFVRTETFHANLGLIQIALDEHTWLVDPLNITLWQPLADVLVDPNIVKILHSLSEDAEVIHHHLGVLMNNVFDTQIAGGFLDRPVQMSYAKMVEDLFDLTLAKEATRSDWLKRPLTDEQCYYAAADVHWLFKVYQRFATELKEQGRYEWIVEDSQRIVNGNVPTDPEQYYKKLRGGWKLQSNRLVALKALCTWRETLARNTNVNRGRVFNDKELIAIAEKMPNSKNQLKEVSDLHFRKIRMYGDEVLEMISQANEGGQQWPESIEGPLPADQSELLKKVKKLINEISTQVNVPAELLARRKGLEAWLLSGYRDGQFSAPTIFDGWRQNIVVEPVMALLNKQWEQKNEA